MLKCYLEEMVSLKLNERLGQVSLILSIIFSLFIIIEFLDIRIVWVLGAFSSFFGIPLYILNIGSFVYTGIVWLKEKSRNNFKYLIYSTTACIITFCTLVYLLYEFAKVMSNFD